MNRHSIESQSGNPPTKFVAVALVALTLVVALYGALHHNQKLILRAIHKNERALEATIVIQGKKGHITVPAFGSDPEQHIDIRTEESMLEFLLCTLVEPLFPVMAHPSTTVFIDDAPFQFIHTGDFFICEHCSELNLPKTWARIEDEAI